MNEFRFDVTAVNSFLIGRPVYVEKDFSFDFIVNRKDAVLGGQKGTTSFVAGTLELWVSIESSYCMYISGYCPRQGWRMSALTPPSSHLGSLRVIHDFPLLPGVSVGLEKMMACSPWFDQENGWFCVGDKEVDSYYDAVEFATDNVAVVFNGRLTSLWIRLGREKVDRRL